MLGWHFLKDDGAMQWPCGRVLKPKVGQTLTRDPDKLELCVYGLHASVRLIDALQYAPGALLCRVELGGKILRDTDKVVASERTVLSMFDATRTLHEFAVWCAREALAQVKDPDKQRPTQRLARHPWPFLQAMPLSHRARWDAARAASRDAQNKKLTKMVTAAMREIP